MQFSGGSVMRGFFGFGSGGGMVGLGLSVCSFIGPTYFAKNSVAARGHAAIDHDLGAGDEARFVGREEQRRVRGVAAVAHEAERDAGQPL